MHYIGYYRVSTKAQGISDLGLTSQKESVRKYVESVGGTLLREYKEIASGSDDDREVLKDAIRAAKRVNGTIVVKKLDRLSRSGFTIAVLLDSLKIPYIESDSPNDSELLRNIKLSIAKDERQKISERTKAALAVLKKRGVKLGNLNNLTNDGRLKGAEAHKAKAAANPNNQRARAFIESLHDAGASLSYMAKVLNENGFTTSRGGQFTATQVKRLID